MFDVGVNNLKSIQGISPYIVQLLTNLDRKQRAEAIAKLQQLVTPLNAAIEELSAIGEVFRHDSKEDFVKALNAWSPKGLVGTGVVPTETK